MFDHNQLQRLMHTDLSYTNPMHPNTHDQRS